MQTTEQSPNPIERHPLYPIFRKLRPGQSQLDQMRTLQDFVQFFIVLYLGPFALIGLIWLFVVSDFNQIFTDAEGFVSLFISLLIIQSKPAIIPLKLGRNTSTQLTASLGSIVLWVGLLIWGPVALVVELLVTLILQLYEAWQFSRIAPNAGWAFLSVVLQTITNTTLANLVGITIYLQLGGVLPLDGLTFREWLPAFAGIAVSAFFPAAVMLPVITQINRLTGVPNTPTNLGGFILTVVRLLLVTTPFAIPFTLLYTRASPAINIFATTGLVLVNLLLYYLSRTNQRSEQRGREMTQLEALGEEIIQAPPDGSTLSDMLARTAAAMFQDPRDILEIRIFENVDLPGFAGTAQSLHLVHPAYQEPSPDTWWENLRSSSDPHVIIKDAVPTGAKVAYGDAIIDKITSAAPPENGAPPACIGGVYFLRHKATGHSSDSLPAVQALASQVASALYRAQVHAETLSANKMAQELEFAGRIQASFLPEELPRANGWEIAASLIPARQTAGDFYDFISLGNNKLGVIVADVADKGTGAALFMALSRTLIRTYAMQLPDQPAVALQRANDRILADTRANQFVTVFYAVIDLATGEVHYCNAGHNPAYLIRAGKKMEHEAFTRCGPALGIFEGINLNEGCTQFHPGDALLLYTDGITEAQNTSEELYGDDRLLSTAKTNLSETAESLQLSIQAALMNFVGDAPQFDDITLMVIKRTEGETLCAQIGIRTS